MSEDAEEKDNEKEAAEVRPVEPEEAGTPKTRRKEKGVFSYYQINEGNLKRLRPFCERCGSGYFMADHGDRYTCGHCGFSRYKQGQK